MAEYTPTTAQVRDYYISGCRIRRETIQQHYLGHPEPDYRAEFDRWLAAHDAEVARQAEARGAERFIAELIGPDVNLERSVKAFKTAWHQADINGRQGNRTAEGLWWAVNSAVRAYEAARVTDTEGAS